MRLTRFLIGAALLVAPVAAADRAPRAPDFGDHPVPRTDVARADAASVADNPILPVDSVHFALDSAWLDPVSREEVNAAATWLRAHPGYRLVLEGRADRSGTDHHNMELALRRADAVRRVLLASGASLDRVVVAVYGEREPLPGDAADNRQVRIYPDVYRQR
jgi:outer membrane protein OmpA-like peptidoglycan-associated protein